MENRIEFYPEWREGDSHGVVTRVRWYLDTGDCIAEYPHGYLDLQEWFWCEHFVDTDSPTNEEICMFDLQFGEGMYNKITGRRLYDCY